MTQSEVSTVAYGSVSFLSAQLDRLRSCGILSEYMLILHDCDVSDNGQLKKPHVHIWACPARRIDITALRNELVMPVPDGRPLGCMEVRTSKRDDWLLYSLHNPDYLSSKGCSDGKHEYPLSSLVHSDGIDPEALLVDSLSSLTRSSSSIAASLSSGADPLDLLLSGSSPFVVNSIAHILQRRFPPLSVSERQSFERVYSHLADVLDALTRSHLKFVPSPDGRGGSIYATASDFRSLVFVDPAPPDPSCPFDDDIGERSGSDDHLAVGTSDNFLRDVPNLPR